MLLNMRYLLGPTLVAALGFPASLAVAAGSAAARAKESAADAEQSEVKVSKDAKILSDLVAMLPVEVSGKPRLYRLKADSAAIDLLIGPGPLPVADNALVQWTETAARAVTAYYRRFPVQHLVVYLHATGSDGGGATYGDGTAVIVAGIVDATTPESLASNWVMTHEMVHTALPRLSADHHWLEEGLATYVEPVARIRSGELQAPQVFADMMAGMPQGLPQPGDPGLDHTSAWGRTYWGGALFCLLADTELRQRSHGLVGLETALRSIVKAGGAITSEWPISRVLQVGDDATGYPVLHELYQKMKDKPYKPDLVALWARLGVAGKAGHVQLTPSAPLAYVRNGIIAGGAVPPPPRP